MHLSKLVTTFCLLVSSSTAWPDTPFHTEGVEILSSTGEKIVFAGVNWPGAADVMIPEGLQYQSIATIVSKIKSAGFNAIRLTYATEMIDHIYNGDDTSISAALTTALGAANGATILNSILANNPSFTASTTRLEVFDAVAAECNNQQIYVHLDNHMSKGEWCCGATDGNGWFGDTYFNVDNWLRGHSFMADHAKSWPALTSMSLRNELRPAVDNVLVLLTYNWGTWLDNITPAINTIHDTNSLPLIFISGLNSDTDLSAAVSGINVGNGNSFSLSSFSFSDKLVFELHDYSNSETVCDLTVDYYVRGYMAMDLNNALIPNHAPVVLTEFGFPQDDTTYQTVYPQCIKSLVEKYKSGWMQWVLAGSYYIREGTQDYDESYGLLNHDWSDWRSSTTIQNFDIPLISGTVG